MKAKEAPEKIYLYPSIFKNGKILGRWFKTRYNQDSVEYIRADAFIEKADKFISSFFHPDDTELKNSILNEFHKYMKGE